MEGLGPAAPPTSEQVQLKLRSRHRLLIKMKKQLSACSEGLSRRELRVAPEFLVLDVLTWIKRRTGSNSSLDATHMPSQLRAGVMEWWRFTKPSARQHRGGTLLVSVLISKLISCVSRNGTNQEFNGGEIRCWRSKICCSSDPMLALKASVHV